MCVVVCNSRPPLAEPTNQQFQKSVFRPSTLFVAAEVLLLLIRITELQSSANPFPLHVICRLLGDPHYANERRSTFSRIAQAPNRNAQNVEAKILSRIRLLRYFD
jgi:hypothetical protein